MRKASTMQKYALSEAKTFFDGVKESKTEVVAVAKEDIQLVPPHRLSRLSFLML